jgi:Trypsin-like peptidase domain
LKHSPDNYSRRSVLIGTASLLLTQAAYARRAVPDDNLLYPVLITVGSQTGAQSFGSGFYLNKDNFVCLVTAKHVLVPPPVNGQPFVPVTLNCMSYSNNLVPADRLYLATTYANLDAHGLLKLSPDRDVAVVKLARIPTEPTGQPTTGPTGQVVPPPARDAATPPPPLPMSLNDGITATSSKPGNIRSASMDTIKRYADVLVGNDAIMYGYPLSLAVGQLDPLQPLLRRGLIAGVNQQNRTVIVDCPSYRGNSGGPVVELEQDNLMIKLRIIGVVSQFVPLREASEDFTLQFNSGYSIIQPMDAIIDLAQ